MEPNKVFYHGGCSDGISAAWVMKQKWPSAVCVGIRPGEVTYDMSELVDNVIYFVDVCPGSVEAIQGLLAVVKHMYIYDHHETSKRILDLVPKCSNLTAVFDMERCGCLITWDEVFPGIERPWWLEYIDDRDRWQWKLPMSKEINTGLYDGGWLVLDRMSDLTHAHYDELAKLGQTVLHYQDKELKEAEEQALPAMFGKWRIWLGTSRRQHRSELGNRLAMKLLPSGEKPDFSAMWSYNPPTDEWWISLRGVEGSPSLVDVCAELPSECKGGGHPRAAGFTIPRGEKLLTYFTLC